MAKPDPSERHGYEIDRRQTKQTPMPVYGRILIQREESGGLTAGGIIIPDTAKEKLTTGIVLAVHPGEMLLSGRRSKPQIEPGQRVLFGKYSGSDITVDGEDYLVLPEREILLVLPDRGHVAVSNPDSRA